MKENIFGELLQKERKRKKLTQRRLAELLYVTPQTICKWEKGQSFPDLGKLCALADSLGISVDQLLGRTHTEKEPAMIAVDGGGSKTEFVLFRADGTILGHEIGGACNPNTIGLEKACEVIQNGIDNLMKYEPNVFGFFGGVAGCAADEHRRGILRFLKKNYSFSFVDVGSDIENVFSADEDGCEIAAIMGTGSVVYVKKDGGLHRFGGWGYRFDGAGGGYDIGRDAISAAFDVSDGLAEDGLLTRMVVKKLGVEPSNSIIRLYAADNSEIAGFAPLVFEAAGAGDPVALGILKRNVRRVARLIRSARIRFGTENAFCLAGGLNNYRELLAPLFAAELGNVHITYPSLPPIFGAARKCLILCGGNADDRFGKKFTVEYNGRWSKT